MLGSDSITNFDILDNMTNLQYCAQDNTFVATYNGQMYSFDASESNTTPIPFSYENSGGTLTGGGTLRDQYDDYVESHGGLGNGFGNSLWEALIDYVSIGQSDSDE
jgi:hypothetical protein